MRSLAETIRRVPNLGAARRDVMQIVDKIVLVAETMHRQVARGVHANPPLTVFSLANPPRRAPQVISRRMYTIEYQHAGNGKDYYHDFKPGTELVAMPDGTVVIRRKGTPVWVDLP